MATLTIRGVPESLRASLKKRAKANRRSLNQEVLLVLEETTQAATLSTEKELEALDDLRARWLRKPMSAEEVASTAKEGRE